MPHTSKTKGNKNAPLGPQFAKLASLSSTAYRGFAVGLLRGWADEQTCMHVRCRAYGPQLLSNASSTRAHWLPPCVRSWQTVVVAHMPTPHTPPMSAHTHTCGPDHHGSSLCAACCARGVLIIHHGGGPMEMRRGRVQGPLKSNAPEPTHVLQSLQHAHAVRACLTSKHGR